MPRMIPFFPFHLHSNAIFTRSRARFLIASIVLILSACSKKEPHKNEAREPKEEFLLENSKFCELKEGSANRPYDPTPPFRFAKELISEKLREGGLKGWIHGAANSYSSYTFTYRSEDPKDEMAFFKSEQFSLIAGTPEVKEALKALNRHDKVSLHGAILENGSPLVHLKLDRLEILEKYPSALKNEYKFDPSPFIERGSFEILGQVHANVSSEGLGRALILDWKDLLIPIAVPTSLSSDTKDLIRGDIIKISVKVVTSPHSTKHFTLDDSAKQPLKVVDSMRQCHGQERVVEGYLVKFDQSPAIRTDIYAIRVEDLNGIARNFTLFPSSTDQEEFVRVFRAVSAKAKVAWTESAFPTLVIRNFSAKKGVRVKANGRINVVSSEQANAQIYLEAPENVTYSELK
ncbi:MAG: hypothetical protein WCI18_06110 [Pseudomonadota bacterium]